jgi:hypothetical protein
MPTAIRRAALRVNNLAGIGGGYFPLIDEYQRPVVAGLDDKTVANVFDKRRQREAAGRASHRPSRIKADPDHASDQKHGAKHGTNEIEVMTGTVWQAPAHAGKHVKHFGDVGENHDH